MKARSTTPVSKPSLVARATLVAVMVLAVTAAPFAAQPTVQAEVYDAQIKALEQEISQYNKEAGILADKRQSYENQLAKLTNERNQIQAKIDLSVAKEKKLQAEIEENEQKIDDNKQVLGETIANMYVDSNISPLEMLASSSNIAEYVDKQANQEQVQNNLTETIAEINKLKEKLVEQKKDVQRVIADQKIAREALVKKEQEKQTLISTVRGKEGAYQKLAQKTETEKRALEQKQQEEIAARLAANGGGGTAVAGDPSKGGYPANLANSDYYNPIVDPWGMYSRQCVSYTAWKVYQKNGYMPYWGGVGNANQWPGNARAAGIPTGTTPKAGSTGVISAGTYGHIVWVESVNSDGTINISQYNEYNAGGAGWGHYSERYNVNPATYDTYIYW